MNANEIDELIEKYYVDPKGKSCPIFDGIGDENEFRNAKLKIMWILKEPYDDFDEVGDPIGGGWDKRKDLRSKDETNYFRRDQKTFDTIIYTAYCILNDFILFSDPKVNFIRDDPSMIQTLKKIAYININKLPAGTITSANKLQEIYEKCKDVLFKQIEFINPDIIIGGNTLQYFYRDLR